MNVLNKFFDKIYCINVDSRTDRWEECQQMFSKYNLDVERFSAFEPDIEPICCIRKTELSLIRTHREIIKKAKEHNYTNVFLVQ
jgi:GR25 family glycosyltransferase involved in LPS biosynthesis